MHHAANAFNAQATSQQVDEHAPYPGAAADASAASVATSLQWDVFVTLREQNCAWMLRYAKKIVGDSHTAEDQVEKVLMKVLLGHTPLVRISHQYLRKSVRRECRRELRWRRRFLSFPDSLAETAPARANEYDQVDAVLELQKYLAVLPAKCAAIVLALS